MRPSLTVSLALSSALAGAELAGAAEPIHVPLTRRGRASHDLEYYSSAATHLRAKYGYGTVTPELSGRRRATVDGIPIINNNADTSYLAAVKIGTPPQEFNVVLDTGSSDLWVTDTSCIRCPSAAPQFDENASSTVQTSSAGTRITYGSGQVAGDLNRDVVSMGNFTIQRQVFLAADTLSTGLLDDQTSGIMGLAWPAISSTQSTPWWLNLLNDNQLSEPEFSFWITRYLTDLDADVSEPGGVFTLGGRNTTLFTGDVEFHNIVGSTPTYWLLSLSQVTVQGEAVTLTSGSASLAAIDTGTTLIGGPSSDVARIWAQVPGSAKAAQQPGFYTFPCRTDVAVTLSFGGKSWSIDTEDMNLGATSRAGQTCVGAIFDLGAGTSIQGSGNPGWVIGDTFLKNVYSVYRANPPSVGFAQLSEAAGGTGTGPGNAATHSSAALKRVHSASFLVFTLAVLLYAL